MNPTSTKTVRLTAKAQDIDAQYGTSLRCVSRQDTSNKGDPQARHKCWFDYHDGKRTVFNKSFTLVELPREITGKMMLDSTGSGQPLSIIQIDRGTTCSVRMGSQAGIMSCRKWT